MNSVLTLGPRNLRTEGNEVANVTIASFRSFLFEGRTVLPVPGAPRRTYALQSLKAANGRDSAARPSPLSMTSVQVRSTYLSITS